MNRITKLPGTNSKVGDQLMPASIENAAGLCYDPWKLTFAFWCNENLSFSTKLTCLHTEILE